MSGQARIVVLRVDGQGTVVAADQAAEDLFGTCVGRPCRTVVGAHRRDGVSVCSGACASSLASGAVERRSVEGAVVRDHVGRVTCTRVGDETVVVVEPGPWRARSFPETLTPRERDVLGRIADGLTNREIALALGVSAATVRTHVEHLLAKLGATSRAQAVSLGYAIGEIEA